MTRDVVETAKREGIPFDINMADGRTYRVSTPEDILVRRTTVIVVDEKDCPHILPLLTMTGISYLRANGA